MASAISLTRFFAQDASHALHEEAVPLVVHIGAHQFPFALPTNEGPPHGNALRVYQSANDTRLAVAVHL
jgi:hypothetical protein